MFQFLRLTLAGDLRLSVLERENKKKKKKLILTAYHTLFKSERWTWHLELL